MNPLALAVLENALAVRSRLLAHAAALWLASRALEGVTAALPAGQAPDWTGPAAHEEAARVQWLAHELAAVDARIGALRDRIAHDTMVVDLHVG